MSKRFAEAVKLIDKTQAYPIEEAIQLAKQTSTVKFDASVEVHFRLNIDAKKSDRKIRTQVALPHGTGKTLKVAIFAGAEGEELINQIKQTKKTDFDIAVAEPAIMPKLGQIAKILGQRGLMPSPKTGTIGEDTKQLAKELQAGKVDIKTDDSGVIHQVIGKVSFDDSKLLENFQAIKEALYKGKPAGLKKDVVRSIYLGSSMGPGIKIRN